MDVTGPRDYFRTLQSRIVNALEAVDGRAFRRDEWARPEGGGGIARVIEDGGVFERGGVNYSHVTGEQAAAVGHGGAPGPRRPPMGGDRRVARPRSAQSPCPHRAHERALLRRATARRRRSGILRAPPPVVVRRRFRPHALLRCREDARHWHRTVAGPLRLPPTTSTRVSRTLVRRYFFLPHPGTPRHRRHVFRRFRRRRLRQSFALLATPATSSSPPITPSSPAATAAS